MGQAFPSKIITTQRVGVSVSSTKTFGPASSSKVVTARCGLSLTLSHNQRWFLFPSQMNRPFGMHLRQVNPTVATRMLNGLWISMAGVYFGYHRMRDPGGLGAMGMGGRSLSKLRLARFILSILHECFAQHWLCLRERNVSVVKLRVARNSFVGLHRAFVLELYYHL